MSSSNPVINQNIEIISVICQQAVAFNGILSRLQQLYPSTGWTSSLLQTRLSNGVRQGIFVAIGNNPSGPVAGYGINRNMLRLNFPQNAIYAPFCSQALPLGCSPSCSLGSATGTGGSSGTST